MNILVLDPANSTGYCIFTYNQSDNSMNIKKWGFMDIKQSSTYLGDQYLDLLSQVDNIIKTNDIHQVALEDYFFSRKSPQGANINCAYRAMIHMKCRELGIHYEILNISLWKKFIICRSTATPDQKIKWGKEAAKKLMTQESLYKKWSIRFPNHSISLLTSKPIKFRYDIVDAVAMAIFYGSIYLRVNKIQYSVFINDIEWKKQPNGTYDYSGGLDV